MGTATEPDLPEVASAVFMRQESRLNLISPAGLVRDTR